MELKGRLKTIADMVNPCISVCDVGTDHAYIPIYLVGKGVCKKALACDIVDGPLEKAAANIRKYGFDESIAIKKGYGLRPLSPGEADTVIIAGMGGVLISEIISDGLDRIGSKTNLVLQPMKAPEVLRQWLYLNKFGINDERLTEDGGKIYCVISAYYKGTAGPRDELYYHIGEELVKNKDPLLEKYLNRGIKQLDKEIRGLKKSTATEPDLVVKMRLKDKIQGLLHDIG